MLISDGPGPTNGLTEIGRAAVWYTTDNAAYDLIVPVVGYATKAPGTYNVGGGMRAVSSGRRDDRHARQHDRLGGSEMNTRS